jgi:hypothetical protein
MNGDLARVRTYRLYKRITKKKVRNKRIYGVGKIKLYHILQLIMNTVFGNDFTWKFWVRKLFKYLFSRKAHENIMRNMGFIITDFLGHFCCTPVSEVYIRFLLLEIIIELYYSVHGSCCCYINLSCRNRWNMATQASYNIKRGFHRSIYVLLYIFIVMNNRGLFSACWW